MREEAEGFVYWLKDETCRSPTEHGYVGACSRLNVRIRNHRRNPGTHQGAIGVPPNFEVEILFAGPMSDCLKLESLLRPAKMIGWNRYRGGTMSALGYKHGAEFKRRASKQASARFKGVPKSDEHRAKQRAAALRRWSDPEARAKQSAVVKESLKGIDRSGANNANFGKHMSEESKQKVRDAIQARGGINGANNPNWRGGRPAH
jgi:hypothetical protein